MWVEALPNAKFLLLYRNPWEVRRSIKNLNAEVFNDHPEYAFEIWKFYNKRLLDFYRRFPDKCLLISSNAFLTDPSKLPQLINEKFDWEVDLTNARNDSFYDGDLFYSEVCDKEFAEFKASSELTELFAELNRESEWRGDFVREDLSENTLVSVIIPCYNQGQFIEQALFSVEKSLNRNYEIIIVNDGSDDSLTIRKLDKLRDRGYNIIDQENKGLANARNRGIMEARGEYILPLDADNKIDPLYIMRAIDFFDENKDLGVVYSNCRVFGDSSGFRMLKDFDIGQILVQNYIDACTVIRKSAVQDVGGFNENMPVQGYEDWDLWIRLFRKGWIFKHVDELLFDYRVSNSSMTTGMVQLEQRYKHNEYLQQQYKDLYEKYNEEVIAHYSSKYAEFEQLALDRQVVIEELQDRIVKFTSSSEGHTDIHKEYLAAMTYIRQREDPNFRVLYWTVKAFMKSNMKKVRHKLVWKYHRSLELVRKARNELKPASSNAANESWSFFRILKFLASKKGRTRIKRVLKKAAQHFVKLLTGRSLGNQDYDTWMERNMPSKKDLQRFSLVQEKFVLRPLISIILPVYQPDPKFLKAAINSVQTQIYDNWELCIVDDASPSNEGRKIIEKMAGEDTRIKYHFREENGHIAACSNDALKLATGSFIGFLDHDDMLSSDALYQVVSAINDDTELDLIYSDEDKVNENGQFSDPYFKPDWSPDSFLARNYINHFTVVRKELVDKVGGFRQGFEGSQDFDLLLRVTELTNKIHHIPKVLYHWRMHKGSTAMVENAKSYAFESGVKALTEAFVRRKVDGRAKIIKGLPGYYQIRYNIKLPGKVSIIIPSKDQKDVLKVCIDSIITRSTWSNYEIILISNNSTDPELFELAASYKEKLGEKFQFFEHNIEFNYSAIMNFAVSKSSGEYIALLNNDTEIVTADWMEAMMEQAQRKSIGAVGVKLLYHNDTIQHAGVVIGLGGVAGHTFIGKQKDEPGYYYYLWAVNNYSSVTAACLMCRKDVYHEVGGFDENLAVEYNDVDFCLKLVEKGYRNVFLPHVVLYHYESLSRGHPHKDKESYARHVREIKYFKDRWQKYIDHDPCYNPNLSKDYTDFRLAL